MASPKSSLASPKSSLASPKSSLASPKSSLASPKSSSDSPKHLANPKLIVGSKSLHSPRDSSSNNIGIEGGRTLYVSQPISETKNVECMKSLTVKTSQKENDDEVEMVMRNFFPGDVEGIDSDVFNKRRVGTFIEVKEEDSPPYGQLLKIIEVCDIDQYINIPTITKTQTTTAQNDTTATNLPSNLVQSLNNIPPCTSEGVNVKIHNEIKMDNNVGVKSISKSLEYRTDQMKSKPPLFSSLRSIKTTRISNSPISVSVPTSTYINQPSPHTVEKLLGLSSTNKIFRILDTSTIQYTHLLPKTADFSLKTKTIANNNSLPRGISATIAKQIVSSNASVNVTTSLKTSSVYVSKPVMSIVPMVKVLPEYLKENKTVASAVSDNRTSIPLSTFNAPSAMTPRNLNIGVIPNDGVFRTLSAKQKMPSNISQFAINQLTKIVSTGNKIACAPTISSMSSSINIKCSAGIDSLPHKNILPPHSTIATLSSIIKNIPTTSELKFKHNAKSFTSDARTSKPVTPFKITDVIFHGGTSTTNAIKSEPSTILSLASNSQVSFANLLQPSTVSVIPGTIPSTSQEHSSIIHHNYAKPITCCSSAFTQTSLNTCNINSSTPSELNISLPICPKVNTFHSKFGINDCVKSRESNISPEFSLYPEVTREKEKEKEKELKEDNNFQNPTDSSKSRRSSRSSATKTHLKIITCQEEEELDSPSVQEKYTVDLDYDPSGKCNDEQEKKRNQKMVGSNVLVPTTSKNNSIQNIPSLQKGESFNSNLPSAVSIFKPVLLVSSSGQPVNCSSNLLLSSTFSPIIPAVDGCKPFTVNLNKGMVMPVHTPPIVKYEIGDNKPGLKQEEEIASKPKREKCLLNVNASSSNTNISIPSNNFSSNPPPLRLLKTEISDVSDIVSRYKLEFGDKYAGSEVFVSKDGKTHIRILKYLHKNNTSTNTIPNKDAITVKKESKPKEAEKDADLTKFATSPLKVLLTDCNKSVWKPNEISIPGPSKERKLINKRSFLVNSPKSESSIPVDKKTKYSTSDRRKRKINGGKSIAGKINVLFK